MTPDEIQRTMEFILEHQAKFAVDIEKLFEHQAKFAADIEKLFEANDRLRDSQATLTASVVRIAEILEETVKSSDERFKRVDERLLRLADAQKATDERLNALITVVERHITGPDHGRKTQ